MVPKLFQEGFFPYNFCWIQKTYFSTQVSKCQVSSLALGLTKVVLKNCVKMWENCKKMKPPPLSFLYVIIKTHFQILLPVYPSEVCRTGQVTRKMIILWKIIFNIYVLLYILTSSLQVPQPFSTSILIALPIHVHAFFKRTCIAFTLN